MDTQYAPPESLQPPARPKQLTGVLLIYGDGTYEQLDIASVLAVAWTSKRISEKAELKKLPMAVEPTCKWIDPPGYWDCLVPIGKPMK